MLYNEQGEFFKALKQLNEQEDTRGPAGVKKMTKERLRFFILQSNQVKRTHQDSISELII